MTNGKTPLLKHPCSYCDKPADGPMLPMGRRWAHAECVMWELRCLLDPEWDDGCGRDPMPLPTLEEKPLAVVEGWIASDDIERPRDAHPVFPRFSPSAYYKSDIPVTITITERKP